MKTSLLRRTRNRALQSQLRATIKDLRTETDKARAAERYRESASLLDRAVSQGIIHKGNADRNKSRLAQVINRLA